ncbi:MAG TPA: iron-containing alcohol dehydrogenase [Galbitalea sp.]|nr:iron-containing alcohol dehydrogenase [Galbitalea sp.]
MSLSVDLERYRSHSRVGIARIQIGPDALTSLESVVESLPRHDSIAILTDRVQYVSASGTSVKPGVIERLSELGTPTLIWLDGDVHADEQTVASAVQQCAAADVVVTIGSGTLCDIGKVAAGDRPHIVVQTAASVNGFADDQSVLLINGVKRTTHSAWPTVLVVDTDVLGGAPLLLNRSGLGDMISMFTAPADWYLASLVDMDRGWSSEAALMTRRYGNELRSIAGGIGAAEPKALSTLAEFVTLSGISMGVAGQTSPSSGMEHTVSHLIDMADGARHRPNSHHGAQVGVATVIVAILWRRMREQLASGSLAGIALPSVADAESRVRAAFDWMDEDGATSAECWTDYAKKLQHLRSTDAPGRVLSAMRAWPEHDAVLARLLESPENIVAALRDAGAPTRFSELENPAEPDDVRWAITNCHLMRNRFTIADLAYLTGNWTPEVIDSVLAEAADLGAGL